MPTSAPHSSTQASLSGSHSCRSLRRNRPYLGNECQSRIRVLARSDHYIPGPVARRARQARHATLHRRDGRIARERDYVCVFNGQIRAALAFAESEQGVWKGKYTRMYLRLYFARDVFADQPCFLGGARMSPPSSLQRSSDDPSLCTLEVVTDGGTYMKQTTHIAWELN